MRRRGDMKSMSEPIPVNACFFAPRESKQNPLDIKGEYRELKQAIREEKEKEHEQYLTELPYRIGYLVVLGILLFFFVRGVFGSISNYEKEVADAKREAERCFLKYNEQRCELTQNPSS